MAPLSISTIYKNVVVSELNNLEIDFTDPVNQVEDGSCRWEINTASFFMKIISQFEAAGPGQMVVCSVKEFATGKLFLFTNRMMEFSTGYVARDVVDVPTAPATLSVFREKLSELLTAICL